MHFYKVKEMRKNISDKFQNKSELFQNILEIFSVNSFANL